MGVAENRGWAITGWIAFLTVAAMLWVLVILEPGEGAVRLLIRLSARASLVLFLLAFSASSLRRLKAHPITTWLMDNRRYLGVAFAFTHTVHLAMLITLGYFFPDPFLGDLNAVSIAGGGLAYVFIYAMAASSNQTAVGVLGTTHWRRLHTWGGYYIWAVFTYSYGGRLLESVVWLPYVAALLVAMALRWTTRQPRKAITS